MSEEKHSSFRTVLRKATDPIYDFKRWARLRVAAAWRRRFRGTVFVGITGSHGKTTATELLGKMLATMGPTGVGVLQNLPKSVAQSLLRSRPRAYRYFVHEISAGAPGHVEKSVNVLQPTIGIITSIGGDHRKAFGGSQDAIAAEKAKLVYRVPADGLAVLNADDPRVGAMAEGCRCRVVTLGHAEGSDLRILDASSNWPERLTLEVYYRGERFTVKTRLIGVHWTLSVSAALLAALELGAYRSDCLAVIEGQEPIFNRMSVHPAPNGARYILDAEKASYFGIEACLGFLETASAPRKTVVVGLISDYPGSTRAHYQRVARMALDRADRVIFTGTQAARVRRLAAGEFAGRLFWEENPQKVIEMLTADALADEIIYVKASAASELHRVLVPRR
jgi:UDP-N-acetylmuramoyl-tripeptide--D-alanyl-D-alanine ligase